MNWENGGGGGNFAAGDNGGTKACPFCGEPIKAVAIKCKHCGELLQERGRIQSGPAFSVGEPEYLYQGRPSALILFKPFVLFILIAAAGWFLAFWNLPGSWLEKYPKTMDLVARHRIWAFYGPGGLALLVLFWKILSWRATSYRICRDRLEYERGVLVSRIDNLELFRLRDMAMRRTLLHRILGLGSVELMTTDESHPIFVMNMIRSPRSVYDLLKRFSLQADTDRGVFHTE